MSKFDVSESFPVLESMKIKRSTCLDRTKFTSSNLRTIGQANSQLILCLLKEQKLMLVLDQHAVHERIRYERLLCSSYNGMGQIATRKVMPPIEFQIPNQIGCSVEDCKQLLERYLGLKISLKLNHQNQSKTDQSPIVVVGQIPSCFRHFTEIGPFLDFLNDALDFVRKAEEDNQQGVKLSPFLLDQVKTQACRGAIRFNETLTMPAMTELIRALTLCKMGFRCAHGRVLVKPLVYLPPNEDSQIDDKHENENQQIVKPNPFDQLLSSVEITFERRITDSPVPRTREQFLKLTNYSISGDE